MGTKKINLLVYIRDYPIGLAGTKRVQQLLDFLVPKDLGIKVISCRSKNDQPAINGIYQGVTYQNIGLNTDLKLKHVHKVIQYFLKGIVATYKFRKRGQTNILYNSGGINIENLCFILWAKIIGYKLVFAIEEDYSFFNDKLKLISRFKYRTIHLLDFLSCRLASAIVVNSIHLFNKYKTLGTKKVVLIPITAKPNYDKGKTEFNNPLQIIYAGTFGDKDGVNYIIEGFELFNRKYKKAKLILLGKSEQQLIYKEKNKDHSDIDFKGFVPDQEFYSLLKESDILCMCRDGSDFANAGFPFKLGEYLATGNPVVSTRVSDVEYYLTSEDAYLIDPDSPQQICSAFEEIVTHPETARKIGLNGLQKCKDHFSQDKNGKILYDLLLEISG
jgi:glycosyltransferase involved in cell wall biosynthesis